MSPPMAPFHFEQFVLDPAQRSLHCEQREIPLRPKTYAVLVHLVENRRRVVPRDELLEEVWRGLRIEPQGVFQSISELRTALGRPEFIRTVRGVGYQWVAPASIAAARRPPADRSPRQRWLHAALVSFISLGVVLFAALGTGDAPIEGTAAVGSSVEDLLLDEARGQLAAGNFAIAEARLAAVLERNPRHLEARLDFAYLRELQGRSPAAHGLARQVHSDAIEMGAQHVRMASAALLSRSPLTDPGAAESYATEAITIADRLRSPDFAAAGYERLGELWASRGRPELAAVHWGKALENYTDVCPSGAKRVRGMLAELALGG